MHVCIVCENHAHVRMAGAEYQTLLLTEELARRPDVRVTYVARRIPQGADALDLPYQLRQIGSDEGIRARAVFFDASDLRRTLEELKPDVIYQQCLQSYTAVCAGYARRAGIPFFFHIAHEFDLNFRWVTLRLSSNTPFDLVECLSGRWGLRHASHIIAQTDRQARLLQEAFGRTAAAVIRNFQPLPDVLPTKSPGPLRIFWVANLKNWKRPELFVQLAESFAGRTDVQFLMAGRPAQERHLLPLMQKIPTVANLRYFGELPIDTVNELMSDAHLHVNTSSFEGFPNTFLQAWGRGAVVATLDVDPDEHSMESLGIGYCAGTVEHLHEFIDGLTRAPQRRQSMSERAFAFVHEHHSMAQAHRLADLIVEAAQNSKKVSVPPPGVTAHV